MDFVIEKPSGILRFFRMDYFLPPFFFCAGLLIWLGAYINNEQVISLLLYGSAFSLLTSFVVSYYKDFPVWSMPIWGLVVSFGFFSSDYWYVVHNIEVIIAIALMLVLLIFVIKGGFHPFTKLYYDLKEDSSLFFFAALGAWPIVLSFFIGMLVPEFELVLIVANLIVLGIASALFQLILDKRKRIHLILSTIIFSTLLSGISALFI